MKSTRKLGLCVGWAALLLLAVLGGCTTPVVELPHEESPRETEPVQVSKPEPKLPLPEALPYDEFFAVVRDPIQQYTYDWPVPELDPSVGAVWTSPDLYYVYYLVDESLYRLYLPDGTVDFISDCPGVKRHAEYKKYIDINVWSNVEVVWSTMNEDFLAEVQRRGLNWDELSDDIELDHLRFELRMNDTVQHYFNALTGETRELHYNHGSNSAFEWWDSAPQFQVQRAGMTIRLPADFFTVCSITPEQLQPESIILEAYDKGTRQRGSLTGLWFRIVRCRPNEYDTYLASLDGTVETQWFASGDAWLYSVETLPGRRYEPIVMWDSDPLITASLDEILGWFTEDQGLTAVTPAPAPDMVSAYAGAYVKKQYNYWSTTTGAYGMVDGKVQMMGAPALYDDWRVNSLELVYTYHTLKGTRVNDYRWSCMDGKWDAIAVYALDYRIHTTTPERVTLAGGMILEPDGWLLPTYPNSTYLVCAVAGEDVMPLRCTMVNDSAPGRELFENDLVYLLTDAGDSYRDAEKNLDALFADGESFIWYVEAGGDISTAYSGLRIPLAEWEKHQIEMVFQSVWASVPVDEYNPLPQDCPTLCLGDDGARCFRFYLGTDTVSWHDGEKVAAWRVSDAWGRTLPEDMTRSYSGLEANIRLVSIPVVAGETAEKTARRFMDAYGAHLLWLSPESSLRITDFQITSVSNIQTNDTRILFSTHFAVKPPMELYSESHWWAGNTGTGKGDLADWLTMGREILLERSGGVWRCLGAGTGGGRLDGI